MMSSFQKMVQDDIRRVFLNPQEFASIHTVEGREISIVLAPDQHIPISGGYTLGVSESSIVLYAAVEDLPERKESGETINIDGAEYTIDKWIEHQGMAELHLGQTRST